MAEKILMKGNEALAEAAIRAGCLHFFGYPITPQTEVAAYMAKRLPKIGGTYMQAESEVSAVNMLIGAASAGVRAMTSSSSPGISLKSEGVSYMAGCDLPGLIINVQRGGPGLGGIQPAQSDYWQATKALGHGDYHMIVFAPSTVQEMVDAVSDAFDLSDNYRIPTMVLLDGMIGQMMEPVEFKDTVIKEYDKSWATNGHGDKREHNIVNSLHLQATQLEAKIRERFDRYEQVRENEVRYENYMMDDAKYAVVAYGAASRVVKGAVNLARKEGIPVGLIRPITVWPFPTVAINEAADKVDAFLTVEMSMGQMVDDVKLAVDGKKPVSFYGRTGGVIPTPKEVFEAIKDMVGGAK